MGSMWLFPQWKSAEHMTVIDGQSSATNAVTMYNDGCGSNETKEDASVI